MPKYRISAVSVESIAWLAPGRFLVPRLIARGRAEPRPLSPAGGRSELSLGMDARWVLSP